MVVNYRRYKRFGRGKIGDLNQQIVRQVSLQVEARRYAVVGGKLMIYFSGPQYFLCGLRQVDGASGRSQLQRSRLSRLFETSEPESPILDERATRGEAAFVFVKRSASKVGGITGVVKEVRSGQISTARIVMPVTMKAVGS